MPETIINLRPALKVDQCQLLLSAPPGSYVADIIELALQCQRVDGRYAGFVFNGKIVMLQEGDTPASIRQRYNESWKPKEEMPV